MKRIFLSFTISGCLFAPHYSFAWGKTGHEIVARIAFSFLDNNTQAAVRKALDNTTIEQASTWMDDVRKDHSYDYMKSWHYVNIEKGTQYVAGNDDNIVNAISKAISALEHKQNLSRDQVKINLMVIFHLVEDFHQPLHVGYGDDKGGNTVQVKYLDHNANLHWVWDNEIIESEHITVTECLKLYKSFTEGEVGQLREMNIKKWIQEPRALLAKVYDFHDNNIDQAYIDKNKILVEQQLLVAGIRLAAVLEHLFKS
jgi:S1/P1 Nuclease